MSGRSLHVADLLLFWLLLLGTLGIGVYHAARGPRTTAEYLVGGRGLSTLPVSISLMASYVSSILMLGFPAEVYVGGGGYWWYCAGIAVGAVLAVSIFVPVLYPLQLTSVNQYLWMRYKSRLMVVLGCLSSVSIMMLYTGTVYYAPATAIEAVTGFPTWASILIGSGITVIYTTIGGLKAVVWTDVFQASIMLLGLVAVTIKGALNVGGLGEVWQQNGKWDRLNFLDWNPDPTVKYTVWSLTIGVGFNFLTIYGTTQTSVQRYSSLPTLNKARLICNARVLASLITIAFLPEPASVNTLKFMSDIIENFWCVFGVVPGTLVMTSLACLSGLVIFSFYAYLGCDPLKAGYLDNANQLVPHFIMDTLNIPGLPGLFMAALCAASLSSASSALNSAAANVWDDILKEILPELPDHRSLLFTKALVVVFGVASTGLAFAVSVLGGTVIQSIFTFASAAGGPTSALFLLGLVFPFVNWKGALGGGLAGFAITLWVAFGSYSILKHEVVLPSPTYNCTLYETLYLPHLVGAYDNTTTPIPLPPLSTRSTIQATTYNNISQPEENTMWPGLQALYSLSYLWLGLFSWLVTVPLGVVGSLLTGGARGETVDASLLHPWVQWCTGRLGISEQEEQADEPKAEDEVKSADQNVVSGEEGGRDNPGFEPDGISPYYPTMFESSV